MKKILAVLLIGLACLSFASCNNDKESSEEIKKGDGSCFYGEIIPFGNSEFIILIQHSTMNCPAIKNGTRKGIAFRPDDAARGGVNTFCSKCMDNELVEKWEKWLEEKEKKDK